MATECHVRTRTAPALEGEDQQSSSFDSAWRWPLNLDASAHAPTPVNLMHSSRCGYLPRTVHGFGDEAALLGAFQIRMNVGEARCRLSEDPRKAQAPPRIT